MLIQSKISSLKQTIVGILQVTFQESLPELLCLLLTLSLYIISGSYWWVYTGLPLIICYNALGVKYNRFPLMGTCVLVIYALLLGVFKYMDVSVICSVLWLLSGIIMLLFNHQQTLANRIYALLKHILMALYYTVGFIVLIVLLYLCTSLLVRDQLLLRQLFTYSCTFAFSLLWPLLFFTIDRRLRGKELIIPKWFGWLNLLFVEPLVIMLAVYWAYCIIQMYLYSLTPRPYVVYIVVFTIFFVEGAAQLNVCSPRSWYRHFFGFRNYFYISLFLIGFSSFLVELSVVGLCLRTFVISNIMLYLLFVSIVRVSISRLRRILRRLTVYFFIILALMAILF